MTSIGAIVPTPTEDEMAAITAVAQMLWSSGDGAADLPALPTRWRFSGRWWAGAPHQRRWSAR